MIDRSRTAEPVTTPFLADLPPAGFRAESLQKELDDLRHDIEQYIRITSEQAGEIVEQAAEIERLRGIAADFYVAREQCNELRTDVAVLTAERDAALARIALMEPAWKFGGLVLDEARSELADLDGGWLEEGATKLGLLQEHEATEPCCESGCRCADYGFPAQCFRITPAGQAAIDAAMAKEKA